MGRIPGPKRRRSLRHLYDPAQYGQSPRSHAEPLKTDALYKKGDRVWYQNKTTSNWEGPATVDSRELEAADSTWYYTVIRDVDKHEEIDCTEKTMRPVKQKK